MNGETVTRLRDPSFLSAYSGQVSARDPESPAEVDITTLAPPEPRPSAEPAQNARNSVTEGWTLYLPEDADVTPGDRMRVRGEVFDIAGEPAVWTSEGLVVQCIREVG